MKHGFDPLTIVSIGMILYGCFGKKFYLAKGWDAQGREVERYMSVRFGRFVFITLGVALLIARILELRSS